MWNEFNCAVVRTFFGIALLWDWNENTFSSPVATAVQFSCSVMSDSLQPHGLQHARPPCPLPTPGVYSKTHAHWIVDAIHLSPLLLPPSVFPKIRVFSSESVLRISGWSVVVSAAASVLPMNIQDRFPLGWLVGSSCSPRHSQEPSQKPQFKSIHSSVLSFLYGPPLTSKHDYWKNHSFD